MRPPLPKIPAPQPEPVPDVRDLVLQSFSYEGRRVILPAISDAMAHSGCWLLERKVVSLTQLEFIFDIQQRSMIELYSALVGAGLELTRSSHLELTSLCSPLKNNPAAATRRRVVHVRLEVSFLEDLDLQSILTPGAALA